jgi:hypothetical protein
VWQEKHWLANTGRIFDSKNATSSGAAMLAVILNDQQVRANEALPRKLPIPDTFLACQL